MSNDNPEEKLSMLHCEDAYEESFEARTCLNYIEEINPDDNIENYDDSFDFKKSWIPTESLGVVESINDPDYFVDVSVKEYNGKQYLVFLKHRSWKAQDRPLAVPVEFVDGFIKLFQRISNGSWHWPKGQCTLRRKK